MVGSAEPWLVNVQVVGVVVVVVVVGLVPAVSVSTHISTRIVFDGVVVDFCA